MLMLYIRLRFFYGYANNLKGPGPILLAPQRREIGVREIPAKRKEIKLLVSVQNKSEYICFYLTLQPNGERGCSQG